MIGELYTNFAISIASNGFYTKFITVNRGVLQGDCLSAWHIFIAIQTEQAKDVFTQQNHTGSEVRAIIYIP